MFSLYLVNDHNISVLKIILFEKNISKYFEIVRIEVFFRKT